MPLDMAIHHYQDSALAKAIRAVGSQTAFANLLGKRQSVVSGWLLRGTRLPAEYVLTIEAATGISRHDLRPDIYPLEMPASQPSPIPEGRTSGCSALDQPDASVDLAEASGALVDVRASGGEAAQSNDDPDCAADTLGHSGPPIGKAAA